MLEPNNFQNCVVKLLHPSEKVWKNISKDVIYIENEVFPHYAESEDSLHAEFTNSENIIVLLTKVGSQKVVGYMYAVPIDKYHPENIAIKKEMMLIDNVAIDKQYQGHGWVGKMSEVLEEEMRNRGYKYFETRANIPNGYADKIRKHYKKRIVDKPERTDPAEDASWGARMIFKIRL